MGTVTLHGNELQTEGDIPAVGSMLSDFSLTKQDMSDITLSDFAGKKLVLSFFPSVDTPVCATSVKTFNEKVSGRDDAVVLCISQDLPFAFSRFCAAEGIENVHCVSTFRSGSVPVPIKIKEGGLAGLYSRGVLVVDEDRKVLFSQQVVEVADEPDYEAVLAALG